MGVKPYFCSMRAAASAAACHSCRGVPGWSRNSHTFWYVRYARPCSATSRRLVQRHKLPAGIAIQVAVTFYQVVTALGDYLAAVT